VVSGELVSGEFSQAIFYHAPLTLQPENIHVIQIRIPQTRYR
jgi:hypothetical protein